MKELKAIAETIHQIKQAGEALCGLSSELVKLSISLLQCFGIFFTLVYAVRGLMQELDCPLCCKSEKTLDKCD